MDLCTQNVFFNLAYAQILDFSTKSVFFKLAYAQILDLCTKRLFFKLAYAQILDLCTKRWFFDEISKISPNPLTPYPPSSPLNSGYLTIPQYLNVFIGTMRAMQLTSHVYICHLGVTSPYHMIWKSHFIHPPLFYTLYYLFYTLKINVYM